MTTNRYVVTGTTTPIKMYVEAETISTDRAGTLTIWRDNTVICVLARDMWRRVDLLLKDGSAAYHTTL